VRRMEGGRRPSAGPKVQRCGGAVVGPARGAAPVSPLQARGASRPGSGPVPARFRPVPAGPSVVLGAAAVRRADCRNRRASPRATHGPAAPCGAAPLARHVAARRPRRSCGGQGQGSWVAARALFAPRSRRARREPGGRSSRGPAAQQRQGKGRCLTPAAAGKRPLLDPSSGRGKHAGIGCGCGCPPILCIGGTPPAEAPATPNRAGGPAPTFPSARRAGRARRAGGTGGRRGLDQAEQVAGGGYCDPSPKLAAGPCADPPPPPHFALGRAGFEDPLQCVAGGGAGRRRAPPPSRQGEGGLGG
jgi:hypothetical protein